MTHDTPPKRIWVIPDTSGVGHEWHSGWYQGRQNVRYSVEYTLTSEAEAMVAAALREAATKVQDEANAANQDAEDAHQRGFSEAAFHIRQHAEAMASVIPAIEALIPQPARAALDKLIAEAVAAATPTMQRAARVLHDEAMAAAYLGENVTEDEAAMLQFIDALGGKTKVINALHALATATKGATP